MRKLTQKVVASGMSLVLAVGLTPLPAFAAEGNLAAGSTTLSTQADTTVSISSTDHWLSSDSHVYDGQAFTPEVFVYYKGTALTKGTDYTVAYWGNVTTRHNIDSADTPENDGWTYDSENDYWSPTGSHNKWFWEWDSEEYEYDWYYETEDEERYLVKYEGSVAYYETTEYQEVAAPTAVGNYTALITGTGTTYYGETRDYFTIDRPADSWSNVEIVIDGYKNRFEQTGSEIKPNVVVRIPGINKTLAAGADYTVSYYGYDSDTHTRTESPIKPGNYYVEVTPAGKYASESSEKSSLPYQIINTKDLDNANIVWPGRDGDDFLFTGSPIKPEPIVLMDGKALVKDADYTLKYQKYDENYTDYANRYVDVEPIEVGQYRAYIQGIGAYASTTSEPNDNWSYFDIIRGTSIGEADIRLADGTNYAYTGSAIVPKPTVVYQGKTLVEGTDYIVSYSNANAVEAGSYRVRIHGINAFYGEDYVSYSIQNRSTQLSGASITLPNADSSFTFYTNTTYYTYTGAAQLITPVKVETAYGAEIASSNYEVHYQMNGAWIDEPKEVGSYSLVLIGKGEYAGQSTETDFRIVEANSLLAASISMDTQYTWNNKTVKPKPKVTLGGKLLKLNRDYTLTYYGTVKGSHDGSKKIAAPKAAGSYYVLITPKGSTYTDTATESFTIKAADLGRSDETTVTLNKDSFSVTKKNQKPTVTVKVNGKKIASSNYTVIAPQASQAIGAYTITVEAKNASNLTGSKTLTYTIGPKATKLKKLTASSKGFTAKWAKSTKNGNKGYQIRYSLKKSMADAKTKTVSGKAKTSAKITKLKSGKKYYAQVRTVAKVNGMSYYGTWSKAKAVTTK